VPPPGVHWSGLTHRGRVRPENEDAFLGLAFNGHEVLHLGKTGDSDFRSHDFVFAVSDGMGGANAGAFASRITIDRVTQLLPRVFRLKAAGFVAGSGEVLAEVVDAIHRDLLHLGSAYAECAGMGATLSLGWFTPGRMYFAHVGDSRIYHLPSAGGLMQLTHDHGHVGWLRRQGRINEREARDHPMRHALHQALGGGQQLLEPQLGAVDHGPGDRFLICSDGLIDGLWDRRIEELIREPDDAGARLPPAERLVEAALQSSGRDNITALVVEPGLLGPPA
jgi:protein phosphatase